MVGEGELVFHGCRVSVQDDEKVPEMNVGITEDQVNILNATELNSYMVSFMVCIFFHIFFFKP